MFGSDDIARWVQNVVGKDKVIQTKPPKLVDPRTFIPKESKTVTADQLLPTLGIKPVQDIVNAPNIYWTKTGVLASKKPLNTKGFKKAKKIKSPALAGFDFSTTGILTIGIFLGTMYFIFKD